jgi:hypothetical protein
MHCHIDRLGKCMMVKSAIIQILINQESEDDGHQIEKTPTTDELHRSKR